jgi:hypothetical protein
VGWQWDAGPEVEVNTSHTFEIKDIDLGTHRYFRDQQLTHPKVTDQYLLLWYFEDWLKKYFFSILQILEVGWFILPLCQHGIFTECQTLQTLSLDPLQYIRTQTLSLIFTLLRDKPEQEQNLLRLLVNKLVCLATSLFFPLFLLHFGSTAFSKSATSNV